MLMRKQTLVWLLLVCAITCLSCQKAQALWFRSHSVEWWVNISDVIAIVEITALREHNSDLAPDRKVHELIGQARETLWGKKHDTITFRQEYSLKRKPDDLLSDRRIAVGDRVLVFLATRSDTRKMETAFWINLSAPGTDTQAHAAYNNDAKHLRDAKSILSLVKARIKQGETTKRRGLIVNFPDAGDVYWDFVITADSRYKKRFISELRTSPLYAIYNLVSYPGPETVRLIRPFLKDNATTDIQIGPEQKTVTYYPLRQAAYLALTWLGEKVEQPERYNPDIAPWLMLDVTGFENSGYFEYGPHRPQKGMRRMGHSPYKPEERGYSH